MYTNRGFLRRNYGEKQAVKPASNIKLPKIQQNYSTPHKFTQSPSSFSNSNYNSLSPTYRSLPDNIFKAPSENRLRALENSQSHPSLSTKDFSQSHSSRNLEQILSTKINNVIYSVFEIYHLGYAYSSKSGYTSPIGMGFLITKSLAVTANSVIPDEEVASRCFSRFTDNAQEVHSFDANSFFYTNRALNFTIIGFIANPESKKPRIPLEFREEFVLKSGDFIAYMKSGATGRNVTSVDLESFIYTAGSDILPGMPIFTYDWHLQGIHHTCTASYRFNQATRIDVILKTILTIRSISTHPDLDLLLTDYVSNYIHEEDRGVEAGRYLYWVEWYNKNIYRYDIPLERWNKIKISNISEFLQSEGSEWSFNWGSRLIYVGPRIFIIGGVGQELSSTKSDVYEFSPDSKELIRRADMLERREGPAIVACQGYLYVMGGKYSYNTCEKYNLALNTWERIAQMSNGRYEPVAVTMQNERFIYVIGGFPQELVGRSIERYDVNENRWDVLNTRMNYPVLHPGVIAVSQKKFALLGGRFCKSVVMVEISDGDINRSLDSSYCEGIRIYEIDTMPGQFETVYPSVLYKEENKVYVMKSQEGVAPQVLYYFFQNLLKHSNESPMDTKRMVLPPLIAKSYQLSDTTYL